MKQVSIATVRCPNTGRELSTGIEMDAPTFEKLTNIRSQMRCPVCSHNHTWSTREAWLGNPIGSCREALKDAQQIAGGLF
jgi:hypothetical protein